MAQNLYQITEMVVLILVVVGTIVLLALQKLDVTIGVGLLTTALGYVFGSSKSGAVLNSMNTTGSTSTHLVKDLNKNEGGK